MGHVFQLPAEHRKVKGVGKRQSRDYLTPDEMDLFLKASKGGRHGVRDYAMMLMMYRHGLRASELTDMRLDQIDLKSGHFLCRRKKGSLNTQQGIEGDESRAIRAWYRLREQHPYQATPYVFLSERGPFTRQALNYLVSEIGRHASLIIHVHPHMLRHSCGFALANKGLDTRLVQDFLGHKNIQHTVRYTKTAAKRFESVWR
jgi:type 1 fimbriae regulatory protein FimB